MSDTPDGRRHPDEKITTGPNDRPRNETIGQTGGGLPDDSSEPLDVSDEEIERIAEKLGAK